MFYIIEKNYVGLGKKLNMDTIEIHSSPALTNMGKEMTWGWCGTSDWATYAHGKYETFDSAKAAITEIFGEVRTSSSTSVEDFNSNHNLDSVVRVFKLGRYGSLSDECLADWVCEMSYWDVKEDMSDAELAEIATSYEAELNEMGATGGEESIKKIFKTLEKIHKELREDG